MCAKIPEQRIKGEHPCVKRADAARNKDSGKGTMGRGEEILSPFFFPPSFARRIAFHRIRIAHAGRSATADAVNPMGGMRI
jgi:hypothetical protein